MQLFAWQPNGFGSLSWFVMAESEEEARKAVEAEIDRRIKLPRRDRMFLYESDRRDWREGQYTLTVLSPGQVIDNAND